MPITRTQVELGELLAGVAACLGARVAQHGRRIEVAPTSGRARLDVRRVEQALDGLVENALDHGGGTICLTAEVGPQAVVLRVADEGPGFPPGFERRAFERFARGDPARGRGGAGLGLAIVQVIARAHGGQALAGRAAGGGAEVRLELPT